MSRLMSALSSSSLSTSRSTSSSEEDSRGSTPLSYSRSHSPTPPSSLGDAVEAEKDSIARKHDISMPLPSHLAASLPPTVSFDDDPSWIPHPADPW